MVNLNERKINPLRFSLHGISIAVDSNDAKWLTRIERDFAFFSVTNRSPEINLMVNFRAPRFDRLPDAPAAQVFPECVVYQPRKQERFIDYHGEALLHESPNVTELETEDRDLAHELAFLYILSKAGTRL